MGSGPPSRRTDSASDRAELDRLSRLGGLLSAADIAGFRVDPDGTILGVNDAFASLIGDDRSTLVGEPIDSIVAEGDLALSALLEHDDCNPPTSRPLSVHTVAGTTVACDVHLEVFRRGDGDPWVGGLLDHKSDAEANAAADADLSYGRTFRALADALPDGIIVLDTDSDVRYANPAVERILGHQPEELVGSSKVRIIPPRLRQAHLDALQRYLETGDRNLNWTYVELPGQHSDGHEVPLGVSLNDFVHDGDRYFVGLFRDITPRKEAERTLTENVAQLQSVAYLGEHALDSTDADDLLEKTTALVAAGLDVDCCAVSERVSERDAGGGRRIDTRASIGCETVFGTASVDGSDGRTGDDTDAGDIRSSLVSDALEATDAVVDDFEEGVATADGVSIHEAVAVAIGPSSDPWGVLETYATEPRKFQDHDLDFLESVSSILATGIQRQEYERRLSETVDELEASNERLEQFAYAVSHDLQEPLRMISSYLQLVENRYGDDLDEDGREFIEYAVDGARRLRQMIDGLLAYSRIDTQGQPFEPVDLGAVLEDVTTDLQVSIEDSNARVVVGDLPVVEGDAGQLRQLFQNLVSNAIKYSGDDPPSIEVTADREADRWAITVRDDGLGIDLDTQERLFQMFQRGHDVDPDGVGIGLAICRRIARRHGGDIAVDSDPGEWTAFTVTLPATESEQLESGCQRAE